MGKEIIENIPSKMLWWIILSIAIVVPLCSFLIIVSIGFNQFLQITKSLVIIVPSMFLAYIALFLYQNRKLKAFIKGLKFNEDSVDKNKLEKFIAGYSWKVAICFYIIASIGPIAIGVIGFYQQIFFSLSQMFYFIILGLSIPLIASSLLYYFSKTYLFIFNEYISFKPLSIFYKLSIPLLSLTLLLLSIISVGIYKNKSSNSLKSYIDMTEASGKKVNLFIDSFFSNILVELQSLSKIDFIKNMEFERIKPFIKDLHNNKNNNIEMYFVASLNGDALSSVGLKANISDRKYFKKIIKKGEYVFSDTIINKVSGKHVIACVIPIINEGSLVGIMGTTFLIDKLLEKKNNSLKTDTANSMLFSNEGKIIVHDDYKCIDKTIGKDINEDRVNFRYLNRLLKTKENKLLDIIFDGSEKFAYKSTIEVSGHNLVTMVDKSEYKEEINAITLQLSIGLILLAFFITTVILVITNKFSVPIRNTVEIFKKIADGDLSVTSSDYLPDEFGDLIRYLIIFIEKIKEVIQIALDSSQQLASSSSNFTSISQDLAQSAQGQAASVEEASASLEQISSSIEQIAQNAKEQSDSVSISYKSMDDLKQAIQEVANFATDALNMANNTTKEAQKGNELMQNTIQGMNSIDTSTKKIADIVTLISDISDQVNLLALNAAIEAARAGEQGRGFAVVADEIGKLAEETALSAKNITELVKLGLNEVAKGKEYVDNTSMALTNIIENINKTDEFVGKIASSAKAQVEASERVLADTKRVTEMADCISIATNEQTITNDEMVKTVNQINQLTQSVAAGAEEIASSSEEITSQTEALNKYIGFFRLDHQ